MHVIISDGSEYDRLWPLIHIHIYMYIYVARIKKEDEKQIQLRSPR